MCLLVLFQFAHVIIRLLTNKKWVANKKWLTNKKWVASAHPVKSGDEVNRSGLCPRREELEGEELVLALASGG